MINKNQKEATNQNEATLIIFTLGATWNIDLIDLNDRESKLKKSKQYELILLVVTV